MSGWVTYRLGLPLARSPSGWFYIWLGMLPAGCVWIEQVERKERESERGRGREQRAERAESRESERERERERENRESESR